MKSRVASIRKRLYALSSGPTTTSQASWQPALHCPTAFHIHHDTTTSKKSPKVEKTASFETFRAIRLVILQVEPPSIFFPSPCL